MGAYRLQTAFFPGGFGSIHLSVFLPAIHNPSRWIIHFPAFAEEMNKSRAVVARTARALARHGVAVVVPDLFGTGDSDGNFVDATWTIWLTDQLRLAEWAREQGATELVFWGLRAGCLLAAELASNMESPPEQLIFWQPVVSGKQLMTQFLRLHMAASINEGASGKGAKGGGAELSGEAELRDGGELKDRVLARQPVLIAGYELGNELFQTIESRHLNDFIPRGSTLLSVFEVVARPGMPENRIIQRQLEQWRQRGLDCIFSRVPGAPFWSTQELGLAPALTAEMVAAIGFEPVPAGKLHLELKGLSNTSSQCTASLFFDCDGSRLVGVLHASVEESRETAVVIVVGGPQYRIGSHRQFVMLARALALEGYPVLRFDYRGMGDSEGIPHGFEDINQDIRSAIDALQAALPTVKRVALWGLCDGATASVCYAASDERVSALILANPWVFTEKGSAKAYLKHYYLKRFVSPAFWSKLLSGRIRPHQSLASLWRFTKATVLIRPEVRERQGSEATKNASGVPAADASPRDDLVETFTRGLLAFSGPVLLIVSGEDLTAAEFVDATRSHSRLRRAVAAKKVAKVNLAGANHTFSRPEWRREVERSTLHFLRTL